MYGIYKNILHSFQGKVGQEIQVAGIPSGNYRPGKYSKFGQSG